MYIVSAEKNLECKDEILNTTDTISIADEKLTCKSDYRISSAIMCFNISIYRFYWLLLLLYKILVKKRILNVTLIYNC